MKVHETHVQAQGGESAKEGPPIEKLVRVVGGRQACTWDQQCGA